MPLMEGDVPRVRGFEIGEFLIAIAPEKRVLKAEPYPLPLLGLGDIIEQVKDHPAEELVEFRVKSGWKGQLHRSR